MENVTNCLEGKDIIKKYKGFTLDIPKLEIPQGFATALIGENGAGKTTLLNILAGLRLDYKGEITYFNQWTDKQRENERTEVKNAIGYMGTGLYYLPVWTIKQVKEMNELLFPNFDGEKFDQILQELDITAESSGGKKKKVSDLSDGNRVKLMLAGIIARQTDLWLLDEPTSPLDPVMRERLNEIIREYIDDGEGKRSVFFSTHNISDMENVTDYAVIMHKGQIVEQGFVEDLKDKYIMVKGDKEDAEKAQAAMFTMSKNNYGFEGLCLSENAGQLVGMDVLKETPTLSQISVGVLKHYSKLRKQGTL